MHNQLLWYRPANAKKLRRLVVVGPYPTASFFKIFLKLAKPKSVTLVVDDGWPLDSVEEIKEVFKTRQFDVKWASSPGLVHCKLYYLEWETASNRTSRSLYFGSRNASSAGFRKNAEVFAGIKLKKSDQSEAQIIDYFEAFLKRSGRVGEVNLELERGIHIYLPPMDFDANFSSSTFLGWLQSGRLCHKYSPDPSFGRVTIRLRNPIPPSRPGEIFQSADLLPEGNGTNVSWLYSCNIVDTSAMKKCKTTWKAKYFLETSLGHWTSDDCWKASNQGGKNEKKVPDFVDASANRNRIVIDKIASLNADDHDRIATEFIRRLKIVRSNLDRLGEPAGSYLHCDDGRLDEDYYRQIVLRQLKNQKRQSLIPPFRDKYISGYAFPNVPTFRGVDSQYSFDDFAVSFCDSLLEKSSMNQSWSWMANSFVVALDRVVPNWREEVELGGDSTTLCKIIEKDWLEIYPLVRYFYLVECDELDEDIAVSGLDE